MLGRRWTVPFAIVAGILVVPLGETQASADAGGGTVVCDQASGQSGCDVSAHDRGDTGGSTGPGSGSGDSDESSNDPNDCFYQPAGTLPADVVQAVGGQPPGKGAWYFKVCSFLERVVMIPVWIAGAPPPAASPATVARLARSRLVLPGVSIRLNPAGDQLVNLPVWLSVDHASWQPVSATASVGTVTVTATAHPTRVDWALGDGTTVMCSGPGTVWTPGTDPTAVSPDCGHVYRRSSAGTGGGFFVVSATVTWDVTWAGAGQSGTVPGLTTIGRLQTRVQESQTVVTP